MKVHKRLIDLHSSSEIVKQIVRPPSVIPSQVSYMSPSSSTDFYLPRAGRRGRGDHLVLSMACLFSVVSFRIYACMYRMRRQTCQCALLPCPVPDLLSFPVEAILSAVPRPYSNLTSLYFCSSRVLFALTRHSAYPSASLYPETWQHCTAPAMRDA